MRRYQKASRSSGELSSQIQVRAVMAWVSGYRGASHLMSTRCQLGCCRMYQRALKPPAGVQKALTFWAPVDQ